MTTTNVLENTLAIINALNFQMTPIGYYDSEGILNGLIPYTNTYDLEDLKFHDNLTYQKRVIVGLSSIYGSVSESVKPMLTEDTSKNFTFIVGLVRSLNA